jgi:NTE family protein
MTEDKKELKLGIALGSGNFLGFSHIGVLKILEENNLKPEYIAGSSIGAIIGACYALNPNPKELEKEMYLLRRLDFLKMIALSNLKISLISPKKIKIYLAKLIGNKLFSDTKIPLSIIAADLISGKEIVFTKGKIIDAVMASISIPGIFPPIKMKDKLLVDGGLLNPTPSNVVKKMGADVVIGVDLTMNRIKLEKTNIFNILIRSFDILRIQSAKFILPEDDKEFITIRPDTNKLQSFKVYETEKFVKEGEKAAKKKLKIIKKAMGRV